MVFDVDNLLVASVVAAFSVAMLSALVAWHQRWSTPSRFTLATFFAAFAVSELDTLARVLTQTMPQSIRDGVELTGFVANFCLGPLFLLYVRELTGLSQSIADGRTIAKHFFLPSLAAIFAVVTMLFPADTRQMWFYGVGPDVPLPGLSFLRFGFTLLTIALVVQWIVYVVWVVQVQAQHIRRLKQHLASTEGMELRWVAVIACALGVYVLQHMIGEIIVLMGSPDPIGPLLDSLLVLIVVAALALWGLRPAPELDDVATVLNDAEAPPEKKYEKSALGPDQANRIARKLVRAMDVDHLYRDPNLTLSTLAGHVGVSLNFVSQTLNQTLGQSFFEFVNDWRVKEAIPLVEAGDTTVLAIAYEVGFNSRSSFYSSFKRVTGMTPTAYKSASAKPSIHVHSRIEGR